QGYCASQLSERGENGWRTRSDLVPFACTYDHDGPPAGPSGGVMVGLSSNLERAILVHAEGGSCQSPPLDPNAPQPALNLYSEVLTGPGGFTLLTPEHPFTPGYAMQNGDYLGGNEDLSRVIYASSGQQT